MPRKKKTGNHVRTVSGQGKGTEGDRGQKMFGPNLKGSEAHRQGHVY